MKQNSPEWYLARCGSLGASVFHDIIATTKTGYAASRENRKAALVVERLTGKPLDTYQSAAMAQGLEREPQARMVYAERLPWGVHVEEVGLIPHPTIAHSHASPDGLVDDAGLLEIKCMQPAAHLNLLLTDKIDLRYATQMQWQMACSERLWVDFVAYSSDFPNPMDLWTARIVRDDKLIATLENAARAFLAEVDATVTALCERYPMTEAA